VLAESIWLTIGSVVATCEHDNEPSGSIKLGGIVCPVE